MARNRSYMKWRVPIVVYYPIDPSLGCDACIDHGLSASLEQGRESMAVSSVHSGPALDQSF